MRKNEMRSLTRELAMQYLYSLEIQDKFSDLDGELVFETLFSMREEEACPVDAEYFHSVIDAVVNNKDAIDGLISQMATNWKLQRISKLDLSVLRLSVAEIKFMEDIPLSASINEAVELAKKYGSEDSGKFVNGILGKIAKEC